jgi:putative hydrolase of the HAD superfamily
VVVFDLIAFDGDDTLWHNERIFTITEDRFRSLVARYVSAEDIDARLLKTESKNLKHFGYGVKGFILSMIETAVEVTEERVAARDIMNIIDFGREMLSHPVELLEGVEEVVRALKGRYRLMIITKGDLFDQESKIARSGLADLFDAIEIVSDKSPTTYRRLLGKHGVAPEKFLMLGNSIRSDVLPVLTIGARALHVPYPLLWAHEAIEVDVATKIETLEKISFLPAWLAQACRG